jgi:hypothetical protein
MTGGVKIATAQSSVMAIAAGLTLSVILVFIQVLVAVGFTSSFGIFGAAWHKSSKNHYRRPRDYGDTTDSQNRMRPSARA